ncbi:unnamed protein product [Caenorhabditis brenneri]
MSSPAYCPMGSPSLLNGNFSENVARLKNFSWSTIFYADPPRVDPRTQLEDLGTYHIFLELASPFLALVYVSIFFYTVFKSSQNIKITKKFLVSTYFWTVVSIESFCIFMTFLPNDSTITTVILCIYGHVFTGGIVFIYKCQKFRPVYTGKLELLLLKVIVFLIGIMMFLFFPALSLKCPPRAVRRQHEMVFWIVIGYQLLVYIPSKMMWLCWKSEEFGIYESNVPVGKLVKKEGFGWIEYYDEKKTLIENTV